MPMSIPNAGLQDHGVFSTKDPLTYTWALVKHGDGQHEALKKAADVNNSCLIAS